MAKNTKNYFLTSVISNIISRFVGLFAEFNYLLLNYYNIIVVLEGDLEFSDMIDGVKEIYLENQAIYDKEVQRRDRVLEHLYLEEVLSMNIKDI